MSRDNSCQVCYVIWADIGFRNAHVSVFPALAGSPPSRIYAEALIRGVCKDSYDVRAAPYESFIMRRKKRGGRIPCRNIAPNGTMKI